MKRRIAFLLGLGEMGSSIGRDGQNICEKERGYMVRYYIRGEKEADHLIKL
jgi:hypothetical protein